MVARMSLWNESGDTPNAAPVFEMPMFVEMNQQKSCMPSAHTADISVCWLESTCFLVIPARCHRPQLSRLLRHVPTNNRRNKLTERPLLRSVGQTEADYQMSHNQHLGR